MCICAGNLEVGDKTARGRTTGFLIDRKSEEKKKAVKKFESAFSDIAASVKTE